MTDTKQPWVEPQIQTGLISEAPWLATLSGTIRAIGQHTNPALRWKIGAGASLDGDLGFDNLERISLACTLDEAFGIEIPDADTTAWTFVSDVAATVARLAQSDPAPAPASAAQPNYHRLGFAGPEDCEGRN